MDAVDDLDHEPHHRARRKELASALPLGEGKLAEEVFVDLPENIARGIVRDVVELTQELKRQALRRLGAGEPMVFLLGQAALEVGFVGLDRLHRLLDGEGDVLIFGQVQQVGVTGMVGQVEPALGDGDLVQGFLAPGAFDLLILGQDGRLVTPVIDVGKLEENEPHDRRAILGGLEVGIGAEIVRRRPKVVFQLLQLITRHAPRIQTARRTKI